LRTQNVIAAATALVVVLCLTDTTGFPYVLSDSLYAACWSLRSPASCLLRRDRPRRRARGGERRIGAALSFRTIGLAPLPASSLIAAFLPS
jgi:hypothetical protein